jgi:hypothetical protein
VAKVTTVLASTIPAALARALDQSKAAGTGEQQRACLHDALKFCSNEVPNVPRITACMTKNLSAI